MLSLRGVENAAAIFALSFYDSEACAAREPHSGSIQKLPASVFDSLTMTMQMLLQPHKTPKIILDILCVTLYNEITTKVRGDLMNKAELLSGFILELRRGTVILCVLAKLKEPTYGYNLIADMSATGISIEANTLYPLLRRLEGQGLLKSSWNTQGAKPRKYYVTTDLGKEISADLKKHWQSTVESMNKILEESEI